jgi:hypothetical protein
MLETEPLRAGRAVPGSIKPRVIRQDLDSRADDEHHEEHVQEVLQLQPPRKAGIDRGRSLRDTRVCFDEGLHALKLPQALREAIRRTSAAAPIGSAHNVLIQRRPMRI